MGEYAEELPGARQSLGALCLASGTAAMTARAAHAAVPGR